VIYTRLMPSQTDRLTEAEEEFRKALQSQPHSLPAQEALRDTPAQTTSASARHLTAAQRAAMLQQLWAAGLPGEAWFAVAAGDQEAAAYQRMLQGVFEEAGWTVHETVGAAFPLKPGVFLFAADEKPPGYVHRVRAALEAAHIAVRVGIGYRSYA